MRLTELDPHWFSDGDGRHGMGVSFECPHCRTERLGVYFANPIDGGAPATEASRRFVNAQGAEKIMPLWTRVGETFDALTLSPSIDASSHGHWHGFVANGEVR